MSDKTQIQISRPFGPTIAKVKIPQELINTLINYVDKIITDEKKVKELDNGDQLAGNVKQELQIEQAFLESSGFLKFLGLSVANWIKFSGKSEIKKFSIRSSWMKPVGPESKKFFFAEGRC